MDLATTLHGRFEQQADVRPDSIAIECDGVRLSYCELNSEANRLAQRLIEEGTGQNKLVLVKLERHCDTVVALLAVLKAGGAFVTEDSPSNLSRADTVITDAFSRSARHGLRVVGAGEDGSTGCNLDSRAQPSSLACVTLERAWTHADALRVLDAAQQEMDLHAGGGAQAVPLQASGPFDCFLPLVAGKRLLASSGGLCLPASQREAQLDSRCRFRCAVLSASASA